VVERWRVEDDEHGRGPARRLAEVVAQRHHRCEVRAGRRAAEHELADVDADALGLVAGRPVERELVVVDRGREGVLGRKGVLSVSARLSDYD